MKALGIIRRVDDLGRIVIPREIRNALRIKEGEPLEIFTDRDDYGNASIILQKCGQDPTLSVRDLKEIMKTIKFRDDDNEFTFEELKEMVGKR